MRGRSENQRRGRRIPPFPAHSLIIHRHSRHCQAGFDKGTFGPGVAGVFHPGNIARFAQQYRAQINPFKRPFGYHYLAGVAVNAPGKREVASNRRTKRRLSGRIAIPKQSVPLLAQDAIVQSPPQRQREIVDGGRSRRKCHDRSITLHRRRQMSDPFCQHNLSRRQCPDACAMRKLSNLCPLPVTQQIAFKRELIQRRVNGVPGNRELLRQRSRAG